MADKKTKESNTAEPKEGASAPGQPTKFATFLQSSKLDPRRVIAASRQLETLQPEDRQIKNNKRKAKRAEGGEGAQKETRKPRSGRPVTDRAIQAALTGKQVSGPTKTRILRAVNRLLEQKKQSPVDLRAIF